MQEKHIIHIIIILLGAMSAIIYIYDKTQNYEEEEKFLWEYLLNGQLIIAFLAGIISLIVLLVEIF